MALVPDEPIGCHMDLQIEASNLANMDVFSLSDPFALLQELRDGVWNEIGKDRTLSLLRIRSWVSD